MFIQMEDAKFKKWSYWSNWIDICNFDFGYGGFLLQMKVNRFNGKKFKAIPFKSNPFTTAQATSCNIEKSRGVK